MHRTVPYRKSIYVDPSLRSLPKLKDRYTRLEQRKRQAPTLQAFNIHFSYGSSITYAIVICSGVLTHDLLIANRKLVEYCAS